MAADGYFREALIGGGSTALDGIDGDSLNNGDFAIVTVSGVGYMFSLNATSGATENSPYIIAPDTNAGTKRWIQQQQPWFSENGSIFLSSNLVKDPVFCPWAVGVETTIGVGDSFYTAGGTYQLHLSPLSGSTAWTTLANWGATDQVISDDTYVTVLDSSSSSGFMLNLFLPGVTSTGDVVTALITIDGTAHTISFTATAATDRFVMGQVLDESNRYSTTTSGHMLAGYSWDGAGFNGIAATVDPSAKSFIISPNEHFGAFTMIRWESSLKIEMKSSDVSTTSYRDYCGVVYRLDP